MDENLISFSDRLEQIMRYRDITASELARRIGVNRSTISRWRNNGFEPSAENIYTVSNALGVNETWLMGFDAPMLKADSRKVQDAYDKADDITKLAVRRILGLGD